MKRFALLFSLISVTAFAGAQDRIYKKDKEIIEAKIFEVGTGEIKYRIFNDVAGPVYTLDKDRIAKVVYENGRTEIYQNILRDPELYADQAKDAVKVNFLSPLLGYTQLNWEHNLQPGRNVEVALGIIGLGKRQESSSFTNYDPTTGTFTTYRRQARGLFLSGGYKFNKRPDYSAPGVKLSHILQGFYAKPEISLGLYGYNRVSRNVGSDNINQERKTAVFSGLLINLGKQWVLGDAFVLDLYGGLGYAIDNINFREYGQGEDYYFGSDASNHYLFNTYDDSGVALSGGMKVGFLLK